MSDNTEVVDTKKATLAEKEAELERLIAKLGIFGVILASSFSLVAYAFVRDFPYIISFLALGIAIYLDPEYSSKFEKMNKTFDPNLHILCFMLLGVAVNFLKYFGYRWKKPALYWPLTIYWAIMSIVLGFLTVAAVYTLLFKCKSNEVACFIFYVISYWTLSVKTLFEAFVNNHYRSKLVSELKKQNEKVDLIDEI